MAAPDSATVIPSHHDGWANGGAMARWPSRRSWIVISGGGVVGLAVIAWFVWPRSAPEPPRAREYVDVNICLLTAEQGLAQPEAKPIWSGMQQASQATNVRVQYLAIAGPQDLDNAVTFVASLAQSQCRLVFAAGDLPRQAVAQAAPTFPDTEFVVVGGSHAGPNVRIISGPDTTVEQTVAGAVRAVADETG